MPSRSTWSHRLATWQPAAMPSPDSIMQPSMTPSPSARAACGHPDGLADAAGLRELDVDAVRALGARGDVRERVAVLVHVDGKRRPRASAATPPGSPAGSGCSTYSTPQPGERRDVLERLVELPVLVHVHHQRQLGRRADRADALHVEAVAAAELELQPAEARIDRLGAARPCRRDRRARSSTRSAGRSGAGRAAARPAGRRACRKVVEGRCRAPTSPPPRPASPPGGRWISSSANGSSPSSSAALVEERLRGLDRLAVVLLRRGLAVARRRRSRSSSTQTTGASTSVAREIVNGSASGSETRAVGQLHGAATLLGRTRL